MEKFTKSVPSVARKHAASNKLEGSSILKKLDILKKECETWWDARNYSVDCKSSIFSVNVAGKGWINVKRTPDAPNGSYGVVYPTDDRNLVIKISRGKGLCNEIAALQALDGLDGFTPKMYPLDRSNPGIRTHCLQRVIVMDAVGDKTFDEIRTPSVKDTYTMLGKLLEAIKTLHATGISHGDLHGDNIRVNSADPSKVFLVDFGLVETRINKKDLSELCFRATVPHRETDTIVKNFCIATGVGVIDSDFWIALFRRLGADPNGLDEATLSAVKKRVDAAARTTAAPPAYANNDGEDEIDDYLFDQFYRHHGDSDNDSEEDAFRTLSMVKKRVAAAARTTAAPPAYANNDGEDEIDDYLFDQFYRHHGDSDNDSEEDDDSDDANAFRDVDSTPTSPRGSVSGAHASREYDRTSH
jgi:tRNA A-37 threonylcarbamoyl transferase component Bud32